MKVVHIYWSLLYGGIETMLVNIANAQVQEGAQVSVILINDMFEKELLGKFNKEVSIHLLHRKAGSKNPLFIFRLNRILTKIAPDAIHLHDSKIIKLILSRRLSHEASMTLHALPEGPVRHGGFCRIFPILSVRGNVMYIDKIPQVFAISNAVKDVLWEKYGVKSTVITNGIPTSMFRVQKKKAASTPFRIVQVSRLVHDKKGQDLLIEAVSRMDGDVEVDFIGNGSSMEYLKHLAHELHVEDKIRFLGNRTQFYIAENLCTYDLFVQPSRFEGFGLTVAEAMAAEIPVLVSSGQGPAEVTCGDKYGWVFNNGDVENLVRMIGHIRNHYPEALSKSIESRRYVADTYDVSVTAKRYLEEYIQ